MQPQLNTVVGRIRHVGQVSRLVSYRTVWKVIPAMSNNKDDKEKARVNKKMERLRSLKDRDFEIWKFFETRADNLERCVCWYAHEHNSDGGAEARRLLAQLENE